MATENSTFSYNPLAIITGIPHMMHTIELQFDEQRAISWMRGHWLMSFVYSALYLILIYVGRKVMEDRKKYSLRTALCCWSAGLSLFSFYAVYRVTPIAYRMVYLGGYQHAVCDKSSYIGSMGGGIWAFLFPLSKLPELFDTSFIVMRKQKMVFLHWYHHVTVFIYCWYSYAYPISTGIWFGIVNYSVHAIMYAYYAIRASGRIPPKWVAKSITTIQLSQMFVGILLNYLATKALLENKTCQMSFFDIGISIFFYTSYAILFGNFYYWTYVHKKPSKSTPVTNGYANGSTAGLTNGSTAPNGHANGRFSSNGYTHHSKSKTD